MEGGEGDECWNHCRDPSEGEMGPPPYHPARAWKMSFHFVFLCIFVKTFVVVVVVIVSIISQLVRLLIGRGFCCQDIGEEIWPEGVCQVDEKRDMSCKQCAMQTSRQKQLPREESKVDGVAMQERSGEVEGGGQVGDGVDHKEGRSKDQLDQGTYGELEDGTSDAESVEIEAEEGGRKQQDVHLDGDAEAEEEAAEGPAVVEEHVDGCMEEEDGDGIVEEVEDSDSSNPGRSD